jgi:nucleoside-diphosphate-sugar epimerase
MTSARKRVLLAGGSGLVGTLIAPYLLERYDVRVLDPAPPRHDGVEHEAGSILDDEALERALARVDALVNLVMLSPQGGSSTEQTLREVRENYAVNTLGLHLLLLAAHRAGVRACVHTSSLSVHYRERDRYPCEETVPLDSPSVYGLTKGLGEQICAYFARWFDLNVIALRITGPRSAADWAAERRLGPGDEGYHGLFVTHEEDLARAYLAALAAVQIGHGRFDAVFIAGDEHERVHNLSKARRLLGWAPRGDA